MFTSESKFFCTLLQNSLHIISKEIKKSLHCTTSTYKVGKIRQNASTLVSFIDLDTGSPLLLQDKSNKRVQVLIERVLKYQRLGPKIIRQSLKNE